MAKVFNLVQGGGSGVELDSIYIESPPTKTQYLQGETFDPAGMVVKGKYLNDEGVIFEATITGYAYSPDGGLPDGTTAVSIIYTEAGITKTASQPVTVIHRLQSIAVQSMPAKTSYEWQDTLNTAGLAIKATYSDGATANVNGTCSPTALNTIGTQAITVTYTERGVTKTTSFNVTVNRKTIQVPSSPSALTYNGNAQSPTWTGYDSAEMSVTGNSGTNAGNYTAQFTPEAHYRWPDGTTTAKGVAWSIAKAAGSLSISPTVINLSPSALSGQITVTRPGDGAISAVSNNTGVATVSVSGNVVTVHSVNNTTGNAVVTISVAAGTNYTAPGNKTCQVNAQFVSTTLNNNTWDVIRGVSDNGQGANYWAVGDRKAVTLNGAVGNTTFSNTATYLFIIGFNHNSALEGGGRIHFQFGKTALSGGADICFVDAKYNSSVSAAGYFSMNSSNTNVGGWASSQMRSLLGQNKTNISGKFIGALPADLRNALKTVTKYTDNAGNKSTAAAAVTATTDCLYLLSEFEVFGSITYANSNEKSKQARYAYYSAGNPTVKNKHNATTTAAYWWLRSPHSSGATTFVRVHTGGTVNYDSAYASNGAAPGLCV